VSIIITNHLKSGVEPVFQTSGTGVKKCAWLIASICSELWWLSEWKPENTDPPSSGDQNVCLIVSCESPRFTVLCLSRIQGILCHTHLVCWLLLNYTWGSREWVATFKCSLFLVLICHCYCCRAAFVNQ
jgi:hypothetical protein